MKVSLMEGATVTARQAAEALGVTERTVRRWIENGRLPAKKVGRSFRIALDDAVRAHATSRAGARPPAVVELAEIRGRYAELQSRLQAVEEQLAREQRRVGALESELRRREVA
jgi:excisionase family DNA binding protein